VFGWAGWQTPRDGIALSLLLSLYVTLQTNGSWG